MAVVWQTPPQTLYHDVHIMEIDRWNNASSPWPDTRAFSFLVYLSPQWRSYVVLKNHRRKSQEGMGGCSPHPGVRQSHCSFRSNVKFFGQKSLQVSSQNEKKLYSLNEKTEFIPPSEMKCPKSGIFTKNYLVEWVGESNFGVSNFCTAAFSGVLLNDTSYRKSVWRDK